MGTTQDSELLVWDTDEQIQRQHGNTVYWQSYNGTEADNIFSIPQLVENNATQLREQYLAFIYELGEAKVNDRRVVEHLEIRPGFSYWWMTLLTEKCNFAKSPQIDNVIKLMAFKHWFKSKNYKNIVLVSSNTYLIEAMHLLADELKVGFTWQEVEKPKIKERLTKRIYNHLPYSLQAFVWLLHHLISRWRLKGVGVDEWKKTKAKTTFVSYLFNLVPDSAKNGYFESRYWATLPKLLDDNQVESNWLHLYREDDLLPNAKMARDAVKRFNQSHKGRQVHVTTHSFLSIRLIVSVLMDWYQLFRLKKLLQISLQQNSGIYWPYIRKDYFDSIVGATAISNLLYLNLFQAAMKKLPPQSNGCYLQENQGWEFGFIYSWRAARHANELVGVPHTPSKFWDLRNYFDQRSYAKSGKCSLPLPKYVGMNGEAAKKMYLEGGYPKDDLVEVEALRYLQLNQVVNHQANSVVSGIGIKTLLVLGDYLKENTIHQMELLRKATQCIDTEIKYIVKPHPACPILAEDYPEISMVVSNEPIPKLIEHCSHVYTSNMTSAAVDTYCAGLPVITALDPTRLNLSPLKGSLGISFVSTPEELAEILNRNSQLKDNEDLGKDYFYLDPDLPRWRELLLKTDKTNSKISLEDV